MCETKEQFFGILDECLKKFKSEIENKKNILKTKEDGSPENNLLKYQIKLYYIEHIKNIKIKINDVFTLSFCHQANNNIIQ